MGCQRPQFDLMGSDFPGVIERTERRAFLVVFLNNIADIFPRSQFHFLTRFNHRIDLARTSAPLIVFDP